MISSLSLTEQLPLFHETHCPFDARPGNLALHSYHSSLIDFSHKVLIIMGIFELHLLCTLREHL